MSEQKKRGETGLDSEKERPLSRTAKNQERGPKLSSQYATSTQKSEKSRREKE